MHNLSPFVSIYRGKLSSSNSIYWQSDVSPILIYISFPMEPFLCRLALWLLNIDKLYKKVLLVLFFFLQPNILNFFQFLSFLRYIFFILKSAAFYEPLVAIGEDYTADQILLYYLANSSKEAGAVNWKKNKNLYKGASLYTENYFLKSWGPSEHQLVSVLQPLEFFGPSSCCCCHHHRDHR